MIFRRFYGFAGIRVSAALFKIKIPKILTHSSHRNVLLKALITEKIIDTSSSTNVTLIAASITVLAVVFLSRIVTSLLFCPARTLARTIANVQHRRFAFTRFPVHTCNTQIHTDTYTHAHNARSHLEVSHEGRRSLCPRHRTIISGRMCKHVSHYPTI